MHPMGKFAIGQIKQNFGDSSMEPDDYHHKKPSMVAQLISWIILIAAVYLSLQCTEGKVFAERFMSFLLAFCFSPCYLIFRLLSPCKR
jgi:hypothetical protein